MLAHRALVSICSSLSDACNFHSFDSLFQLCFRNNIPKMMKRSCQATGDCRCSVANLVYVRLDAQLYSEVLVSTGHVPYLLCIPVCVWNNLSVQSLL